MPDTIIPYDVHLSNVAMEILVAAMHSQDFNTEFAVQVALLHDVLEDTAVTAEELEKSSVQKLSNQNYLLIHLLITTTYLK